MSMIDCVEGLALLERRLNRKEPYGVYDLNIMHECIKEIKQLRQTVAVLDAELNKESK